MAEALVDALSMAAVFLVDCGDDGWVFSGVPVGDFSRGVLGAVIDNHDLHPVSAGEKTVDAFFHVAFRIVAGNGDGKQLHRIPSFSFSAKSRAESTTASMS